MMGKLTLAVDGGFCAALMLAVVILRIGQEEARSVTRAFGIAMRKQRSLYLHMQ